MEKNVVLDLIIEFVKAVNTKNKIVSKNDNKEHIIGNTKYLLGQIIRQYEIAEDHYYISSAAEDLWRKLSTEDIWKYKYRASVKCSSIEPVCVKKYKNNENNSTEEEVKNGEKFIFRDVFHDEHIIPIKVIIDKLMNLKELTYPNVEAVLDQIFVCRILKSEDREIPQKSKRPFDFERIRKKIYADCGIELKCRITEKRG